MNFCKCTIFATLLAAGSVAPLCAAEVTDTIGGYFRVQSALSTGTDEGYVVVRGPFSTRPDMTKTEALTDAGTVMRLRAVADTYKGNKVYKIGNLSSQGIEVFGIPQTDYLNAVADIAANIDQSDYEAAAYSLQRAIRDKGYFSSARAIVEAVFQVVAGRLDKEISNLTAEQKEALGWTSESESLEEFAQRFNKEVSANVDLHAYLEPVGNGQYRVAFNWIDCAPVSEFYLKNEQNKKSFELGFTCMRKFMEGREGLGSGESIDPKEAALWLSWGYDVSEKYSGCLDGAGVYRLTYEQIFADHELLYNWLKMYIRRFLDPETAPDAEILGINFKAFATEMRKHAIINVFFDYIPSIQEGQRLYLTSGRYLADGHFSTFGTSYDNIRHFGLIDVSKLTGAGNAAVWNLLPMDETDNYFAIAPVAHRVNDPNHAEAHFSAMYFDFPIEALNPEKMTLRTLTTDPELNTATLEHLGEVKYVNLEEDVDVIARRTPVLVENVSENVADNIVKIPFYGQKSDYNPEVSKPSGFDISDDETSKQHAPARAGEADDALHYAVFFATPANEKALKNLWDINLGANKVYALTTREGSYGINSVTGQTSSVNIKSPWFMETATIPQNHSFILSQQVPDESSVPGIAITPEGAEPTDETETPTGADTIPGGGTQQPGVLYDLQGRPATEAIPGQIYILDGKKILVK